MKDIIEQQQVTRDDLYFPKIGEPKEIWAFVSDFTAAVALWAIKQSPYPCPENLKVVVEKLHASIAEDFDGDYAMKKFGSFREVEQYAATHLRQVPEYLAWNERKNGNKAPLQFTSRYDGPGDPDDNFIDLGALERNVAMHIVQQAILT